MTLTKRQGKYLSKAVDGINDALLNLAKLSADRRGSEIADESDVEWAIKALRDTSIEASGLDIITASNGTWKRTKTKKPLTVRSTGMFVTTGKAAYAINPPKVEEGVHT